MTARFMIAGTGSGCGKTTITCALLAALSAMQRQVRAFKCGPDYIDPMFHTKATGVMSRNLDIFLMGEQGVLKALQQNSTESDITLIEGVMGLFDGQSNTSFASSNHLALLTKTPTVLVANASGMARSVCALISGYLNYEPNMIKAVLLNNVRQSSYDFYKQMIESELDIPVIGYMPRVDGAQIESRHLGLVTPDEISEIREKISLLRKQALL
ncbi:MAG: cobyrinic acid a,c-diamide synthase, partial [Coriobacteriia bacterium]|nr:cobyrinic acid a,c-diamide synthase [Coriobacteriia bacterium]